MTGSPVNKRKDLKNPVSIKEYLSYKKKKVSTGKFYPFLLPFLWLKEASTVPTRKNCKVRVL